MFITLYENESCIFWKNLKFPFLFEFFISMQLPWKAMGSRYVWSMRLCVLQSCCFLYCNFYIELLTDSFTFWLSNLISMFQQYKSRHGDNIYVPFYQALYCLYSIVKSKFQIRNKWSFCHDPLVLQMITKLSQILPLFQDF
jgi:hypothetical protein